jgi:hypothetical protein
VEKRALAALILNCEPQDLLGFAEHEDGTVVAIAPNGMKFSWARWVIEDYDYEHNREVNGPPYPPIEIPKPKPKPPAKPVKRRQRKEK